MSSQYSSMAMNKHKVFIYNKKKLISNLRARNNYMLLAEVHGTMTVILKR